MKKYHWKNHHLSTGLDDACRCLAYAFFLFSGWNVYACCFFVRFVTIWQTASALLLPAPANGGGIEYRIVPWDPC